MGQEHATMVLSFRINLKKGCTKNIWGHSKGLFARNFLPETIFDPLPPLFVPVCFTCTPPQCTFALVRGSLSEKVSPCP